MKIDSFGVPLSGLTQIIIFLAVAHLALDLWFRWVNSCLAAARRGDTQLHWLFPPATCHALLRSSVDPARVRTVLSLIRASLLVAVFANALQVVSSG